MKFKKITIILFGLLIPLAFQNCDSSYEKTDFTENGSVGTEVPINTSLASVTLTWNANSEMDLANYKIYFGNRSGVYLFSTNVGLLIKDTNGKVSYVINNLDYNEKYYFSVSAFDLSGNESGKSVEAFKQL